MPYFALPSVADMCIRYEVRVAGSVNLDNYTGYCLAVALSSALARGIYRIQGSPRPVDLVFKGAFRTRTLIGVSCPEESINGGR